MCDKKCYNLLKIFSIPQHHLRFGTLKVEGGQGGKKNCAYLWKYPGYVPGMGREITLLTVKRPVISIFGMLYIPTVPFLREFLVSKRVTQSGVFLQ